MRKEDIDWTVYHIISATDTITIEEISSRSGYSLDIIECAISRLKKTNLIDQENDNVRALSIPETILRCQIKYQVKDSPIYLENGVIKVKPEFSEKK